MLIPGLFHIGEIYLTRGLDNTAEKVLTSGLPSLSNPCTENENSLVKLDGSQMLHSLWIAGPGSKPKRLYI